MNDFIDIKVGDTVYIRRAINYTKSLSPKSKSFFVPIKVDRLTAKVFYSGDLQFYKKDGTGFRDTGCRAYKLGESIERPFSKEEIIVKDQSKEHRAFNKLVETYFMALEKLKKYEIQDKDHVLLEDLISIIERLGE